jgi:hypothetical protein
MGWWRKLYVLFDYVWSQIRAKNSRISRDSLVSWVVCFFCFFLSYFLKSFELPHRKTELNPKWKESDYIKVYKKEHFGDDLTSHEISDHSIHHLKERWIKITFNYELRRHDDDVKVNLKFSPAHHHHINEWIIDTHNSNER